MFTGIVQGFCPVVAVHAQRNLRHLRLLMSGLVADLALGASVAVNGTCLTVTQIDGQEVAFDVIQETLDHTNLGLIEVGTRVNVERSLQFGDEIGGHVLSGHVSSKVQVSALQQDENMRVLRCSVPIQWMKYLLHKGFVALDGASLTIASVDTQSNEFAVALIPETIARTSLGAIEEGDWLNLEIDKQTQAVVDTTERLLDSAAWRERFNPSAA